MNLYAHKYTLKKNATLGMFARKCCQTYVPSLVKGLQSLINYFLLDFNPSDMFCHHKIFCHHKTEFGNQEFLAIHVSR